MTGVSVVLRARAAVTGFEDRRTEECWEPLEAGRGKEMAFSLELPEGTKSCLHLHLPRPQVRPLQASDL